MRRLDREEKDAVALLFAAIVIVVLYLLIFTGTLPATTL